MERAQGQANTCGTTGDVLICRSQRRGQRSATVCTRRLSLSSFFSLSPVTFVHLFHRFLEILSKWRVMRTQVSANNWVTVEHRHHCTILYRPWRSLPSQQTIIYTVQSLPFDHAKSRHNKHPNNEATQRKWTFEVES